MRVILFILFFSLILCFPTQDRKDKLKEQKEKVFECLNELATESFARIINENKDQKLSNILKKHRVSLTKQDKDAIKECRKRIILEAKDDINKSTDSLTERKVNLKRTKTMYEK